MSEMRAMPLDLLAARNEAGYGSGQPLCPACIHGRLHPYRVTIGLGGYQGVDYLDGWVAMCVGNAEDNQLTVEQLRRAGEVDPKPMAADVPPCGFTMAMTPGRFQR